MQVKYVVHTYHLYFLSPVRVIIHEFNPIDRPVARNFERGVLFDQKWTFTCMMINKGTESRGSGGMPPQKIF